MRVVFISDTHNQLGKMTIPEGDLLIHCGDWTMQGTIPEVTQFNLELSNKAKGKFTYGVLCVAGNHDYLAQREPNLTRELITSARYCEDELVEIDGKRIYLSPWVPVFGPWAFMLPRGKAIKTKWELIPDKLDILVTHGPPHNILDEVQNVKGNKQVGCEELKKYVKKIKPKVHAFGHIHEGFGSNEQNRVWQNGPTKFVNASMLNDFYKYDGRWPVILDI